MRHHSSPTSDLSEAAGRLLLASQLAESYVTHKKLFEVVLLMFGLGDRDPAHTMRFRCWCRLRSWRSSTTQSTTARCGTAFPVDADPQPRQTIADQLQAAAHFWDYPVTPPALRRQPFFPKLVDFLSSGAVVAMVWEGNGVVATGRAMIGKTNPLASDSGTIRRAVTAARHARALLLPYDSFATSHWLRPHLLLRAMSCDAINGVTVVVANTCRGDFAVDMGRNIIHGSDSVDVSGLNSASPACCVTVLLLTSVIPPRAESYQLTHLFASLQSAQKEIALWFKPSEIAEYQRATEQWLYEK